MDKDKQFKTTLNLLLLLLTFLQFCPFLHSQILKIDTNPKVLGLGAILEYDQSSINGYTLLRTTNEIYRINSDRSFLRLANMEGIIGIHIAPDENSVLVDFVSGSDVVVDPMQWTTLQTLSEGEYPYDPFSLDSQKILYKNKDVPTVFNISDQTNISLKEITDTKFVFWSNSRDRIYSVTRGEDEYTPNPYTHKYPYYLNEWNVLVGQLISSIKMDNLYIFNDNLSYRYSQINLIKMNPMNNIVANTLENFRIHWYNSYLMDTNTGKQLYFWNAAKDYSGSIKTAISPNGRWIAYDNWVNVGFIDTVNIDTSRFFSLGPYTNYTGSAFSADSSSALFRESTIPSINMAAAIDLVDLNTGSIKNHYTLLNQPVAKADFTDEQKPAFLFGNHTYSVIHQDTGDLLVEGVGNRKHQDLIVLPDLNQLLLCAGSIYIFADFAQKKEVRWHEDPDLQNIQFLSRQANTNELVAAGYSIVNDVTATLIKTLDFPAMTTKAIIQDGSAIITAFNRSEDGRLIVTGYEDGSVKIRNIETKAVEQTVKQSASKILYVSLLSKDRVIAVDEERNALVWNLSLGQMERTINRLHLPARVSIRRDLLFAGTEVYDLTNGEKKYRFNEESSDLYSIEISPNEESLLTSAANGETYLWNLPLLFDLSNGIKDYGVH